MKQNCWKFKNCGREHEGGNVMELGECPAASAVSADGLNNGVNGGRCCWAIAGTLCEGEVQGTYAEKMMNCMDCDFYLHVYKEEGPDHRSTMDIISRLKDK